MLTADQTEEAVRLVVASLRKAVEQEADIGEGERWMAAQLLDSARRESGGEGLFPLAVMAVRGMEYRGALVLAAELSKQSFANLREALGEALDFGEELAATADSALEQLRAREVEASERGRKAANPRHGQKGGYREKQEAVRQAWKSGKYPSRDKCAEAMASKLGLSISAARKALRNTPDPT